MFLEVKNFRNRNPIWGFHPNFLFGNHHFLVISHIDGVSWSDCLPRGVYIRITIEKMNFSKSMLGGKLLWGHDFSNFLVPKKRPRYGRNFGENFFFISQS